MLSRSRFDEAVVRCQLVEDDAEATRYRPRMRLDRTVELFSSQRVDISMEELASGPLTRRTSHASSNGGWASGSIDDPGSFGGMKLGGSPMGWAGPARRHVPRQPEVDDEHQMPE